MLLNPSFLTSKLQAMMLQQQSFLQKCEAWMDFLSRTEQKLAAEISGNYQSLLEQQQDHEVIFFAALVCIQNKSGCSW